jgi:hypothetical protein
LAVTAFGEATGAVAFGCGTAGRGVFGEAAGGETGEGGADDAADAGAADEGETGDVETAGSGGADRSGPATAEFGAAAIADALSLGAGDASFTTAMTPMEPPTSAAAATAKSTPREALGGNAAPVVPVVKGADVTPAAGRGVAFDASPAAPVRDPAPRAGPCPSELEVTPRALSPAATASASASADALANRCDGSRSRA